MIIEKIKNWFIKYERPISSVSLVGGFVFDALTLRRIDALWDNVWTAGHLLIVAVCIILINRNDYKSADNATHGKKHFWLVNILQFFFGGLLSTYLVFYFRSSSLLASWPFLFLLLLAFWANEALKRHYERLSFQIGLFYLSLFSFTIYYVPVLFHQIGKMVFVVSGLVSLVLMMAFLIVLKKAAGSGIWDHRRTILTLVLGIFALMNLMYFFNLIPPIPLSLKDSGVYYWYGRNASGNLMATYEDSGWKNYFSLYDNIHIDAGQPVYVYSAVFSPTNLNLKIAHDWQHYNQVTGQWQSNYRINLSVIGGRDGGYRTYSQRSNLEPGKWRVSVETLDGQVIGTVRFNLLRPDGEVKFRTEIK